MIQNIKSCLVYSICLVTLFFLYTEKSFSQDEKRIIGVSLFLKGGPIYSQWLHRQYQDLTYTEQKEQFNINSFTVNLGSEFHLGKIISAQTGVNYFFANNQVSYTFERGKGYSDYYMEINNYKASYSYVQIPIIIKINVGKKVKYYFSGGMVLGFLVNENIKGKRIWDGPDWNNMPQHAHKEYIGNAIKTYTSNEDGVIASLGIEIPLNKNYLVIELFGRKGLHTYIHNGYWSNNWGINMGYRFVLQDFKKEKS